MTPDEAEAALSLMDEYKKLFTAEIHLRKKLIQRMKDGEPIPPAHLKLSERIKLNCLWGI